VNSRAATTASNNASVPKRAALLTRLDDEARALAHRPLDDERLRWVEYRPRPRRACLADLGRDARKAAHRLLAAGPSPHGYGQAMAIMPLEEVLGRRCIVGPLEVLNLRPARGQIAWSEFGERSGDPRCRRGVDGEIVVAAA